MFPGVPTVVAQTDEEAEYLGDQCLSTRTGLNGQSLKLKAPVETMEGIWSPAEKMSVDNFMRWAQIGYQKQFQRFSPLVRKNTMFDDSFF